MAYHNSYIVNIKSGTIGIIDMSTDGLQLYLNSQSSFQTNVPILFQGNGSGNTYLGGGGNGPWLHLWNPYTTDLTKTGLIFDKADTGPSILRYGNGLGITGSLYGNGKDSTNLFHQGWENVWNVSNGDGETDYINIKGASNLRGGFRWYDKLSNQLARNISPIMILNGNGDLSVNRGYVLTDMSKTSILNLSPPKEGTLVNDSTNHLPVIYENGHWYHIQLGKEL